MKHRIAAVGLVAVPLVALAVLLVGAPAASASVEKVNETPAAWTASPNNLTNEPSASINMTNGLLITKTNGSTVGWDCAQLDGFNDNAMGQRVQQASNFLGRYVSIVRYGPCNYGFKTSINPITDDWWAGDDDLPVDPND